jgi:NitT/TauT family transport system substrate-binding protein
MEDMYMKQVTNTRPGTWTRVAAGLVVLLAGTTACGSEESSEGADAQTRLSMNVGTQSVTIQTGFAQLADALGYFDDENLDVNITVGESTAASTQALIGGSLDVYFGGPEPLSANEQGADVRFIAAGSEGSLWDLITTDEIKTIEDLAGKNIAVSAVQSISTVNLSEALQANGVDPSSVNFINVGGTGKRYAALVSGQVQAAALGIPVNYQAEADGLNNFGNLNDLGTPIYAGVLVTVTDEWAQAHKEELNRFLRAYQRTINALYDPEMTDQIADLYSKVLEIEAPLVSRGLEDIFFSGSVEATPKDLQITVESLQRAADRYLEFGALTKPYDVSDAVDMSYLEAAQESLEDNPPADN